MLLTLLSIVYRVIIFIAPYDLIHHALLSYLMFYIKVQIPSISELIYTNIQLIEVFLMKTSTVKKVTAAILCPVIVCSMLVGCGDSTADPENNQEITDQTAQDQEEQTPVVDESVLKAQEEAEAKAEAEEQAKAAAEAKAKAEAEAKARAEEEARAKAEQERLAKSKNAMILQAFVPLLIDADTEMDDLTYNFIVDHSNLFPAKTGTDFQAAKELVDSDITYKHLDKNIKPYLDKMVKFTGTVISVEEADDDEIGTYSYLHIITDEFESITAIYLNTTGDLLQSDTASIIGVPVASYSFPNVSGGTTKSIFLAASHVQQIN